MPVNLMIKPASGNCNMRCKYCFYHDVTENREVSSYGIMTADTLEVIVKKALENCHDIATFVFQGGEPTLAGFDFFVKLIEFEKKYNVNNVQINNSIQTNGYVIDDRWAGFFHDNNFLVGLSLDGPKEVNDESRIDAKGEGTFKRILHTASVFDSHKVEYNILTVVSAQVAKNINRIYGFFRKNKFDYLQFIPCLDPLHEERGKYPHSLTPALYADFLKRLFDMWYRDVDGGQFVYIRYFENLMQIIAGYYPEACGMLGVCGPHYIIEADGGVYPCDFYVLDQYKIGSILTDSFQQMEEKRNEIGFVEASRKIEDVCRQCKWYRLCYGGCKRDRQLQADNEIGLNYYCEAYKEFFEYAADRLVALTRKILEKQRAAASQPQDLGIGD